MKLKKWIAFLFLFLVFMQSLAGSIAIHFSNHETEMVILTDVLPADSWELEDGSDKDNVKDFFSIYQSFDLSCFDMLSPSIFAEDPPLKALHIGYNDIQSPPPDNILVG